MYKEKKLDKALSNNAKLQLKLMCLKVAMQGNVPVVKRYIFMRINLYPFTRTKHLMRIGVMKKKIWPRNYGMTLMRITQKCQIALHLKMYCIVKFLIVKVFKQMNLNVRYLKLELSDKFADEVPHSQFIIGRASEQNWNTWYENTSNRTCFGAITLFLIVTLK